MASTTKDVPFNTPMKTKRISNGAKAKNPTKLCVRCNIIKDLSEFYTNPNWKDQNYRDAWCKECLDKYVFDLKSVKEYCHFNNRGWDDSFWEAASKKAKYVLAKNTEFLDDKTPKKRKLEIQNRTICRQWFSMMNYPKYYTYQEHIGEDGQYYEEIEIPADQIVSTNMGTERRVYDTVWRGHYTPSEIEELNQVYADIEEDFVLDNANIRDYARKVAKASFDADKAGDNYRSGLIAYKEYKDALDTFDSLSKSSNFAACRRKPGESSGLGNLGEIILRLETQGALTENHYEFPDDEIDQIIHAFEHSVAACDYRGELD